MPDFAMPVSICSPAHAHLSAAVQDPVGGSPACLFATPWFARRGTVRFVTIDSTAADSMAAPMCIESDLWWGRISEYAIAVGYPGAYSSRRTDR